MEEKMALDLDGRYLYLKSIDISVSIESVNGELACPSVNNRPQVLISEAEERCLIYYIYTSNNLFNAVSLCQKYFADFSEEEGVMFVDKFKQIHTILDTTKGVTLCSPNKNGYIEIVEKPAFLVNRFEMSPSEQIEVISTAINKGWGDVFWIFKRYLSEKKVAFVHKNIDVSDRVALSLRTSFYKQYGLLTGKENSFSISRSSSLELKSQEKSLSSTDTKNVLSKIIDIVIRFTFCGILMSLSFYIFENWEPDILSYFLAVVLLLGGLSFIHPFNPWKKQIKN